MPGPSGQHTHILYEEGATKKVTGYVSNIGPEVLDGPIVVAAHHSLWQVEKSFRMAKSDIRARPMFHHQRDSIEAHLTVVFCALAVARHLQEITGISIKKLIQTLRPLRTVTIDVNGHELTAAPTIHADTQDILDSIAAKSTHYMWHESGQGLDPQVRVLDQPGPDIGLERIEPVRGGAFAFPDDPVTVQVKTDGLAVPPGAPGDLADRHSLSSQCVDVHVFLPCQHEGAGLSHQLVRGQRPPASRRARPRLRD
jgi:hypothetical protein